MIGLYLIFIIAAWLFAGWTLHRMWEFWRPSKKGSRLIHGVIGIIITATWLGVAFWFVIGKKAYYDSFVAGLCEESGGVKVYEEVHLSDKYFDGKGVVHVPPKSLMTQSDEFYFVQIDKIIRDGSPKITKLTTQVIRKRDNKILGESTRFARSGGDLPGPWRPSSYSCPSIGESTGRLQAEIFKRREQ